MMRRIAAVALLSLLTLNCASTTIIRSVPSGATVKSVEGGVLGQTPYTYSDMNIVNQPKTFTLQADGYESKDLVIKRDQWDPARVVVFGFFGLFFFFPYAGILWSADYAPTYVVELKPRGSAPLAPDAPGQL